MSWWTDNNISTSRLISGKKVKAMEQLGQKLFLVDKEGADIVDAEEVGRTS